MQDERDPRGEPFEEETEPVNPPADVVTEDTETVTAPPEATPPAAIPPRFVAVPGAPVLTYAEQLSAMAAEANPGDILEDDPNKVFYVGVWGPADRPMLANYCCRLCKFATTGGTETFMTHYKARHIEKPPEAVQRPRSGLIGTNGQPL